MSPRRKPPQRNRRPAASRGKPGAKGAKSARSGGNSAHNAHKGQKSLALLYGWHPVTAALANPNRRCRRLMATADAARRLADHAGRHRGAMPAGPAVERVESERLAALLPDDAVHQGLVLEADPLPQPDLDDVVAGLDAGAGLLVALDQVTDPHNVGAILRSAAAFGAAGVIAPERHSAPETGVLAKAASGALDRLPYIRVVNLARALAKLKDADFWVLGLDSGAALTVAAADPGPRRVLVMGSEGAGLRRLTRESCDQLLRLPTQSDFGQLNVSNAAAVALYELLGRPSG